MSFLLPCGGIMNNIDLLKTITNYKKIKNPAYPAQESLLIHLFFFQAEDGIRDDTV